MKKKLKIVLATAAAIVAVVGIMSLAYLTDRDEAKNTFTVGQVKMNVYEPSWDGETWDGTTKPNEELSDTYGKPQAENMYPTKEIPKDPRMSNTGVLNSYMWLRITIPVRQMKVFDEAQGVIANAPVEVFEYTINEYQSNPDGNGWLLKSAQNRVENGVVTGHTYIFAYYENGTEKIFAPGDVTDIPLFNKVKFVNAVDLTAAERDALNAPGVLDIPIDGMAIQSDSFATGDAAFNAFVDQVSASEYN